MNKEVVLERLKKVIDPELGVDIVGLGLVYGVVVEEREKEDKGEWKITITMTLTSPGCPLSGVFEVMIRDALRDLEGVEVERDVVINLTFDPPWMPDMMNPEVSAELGFD